MTKFDDAGNLIQIGFDPYDAMGDNSPSRTASTRQYRGDGSGSTLETGEFDLDNEMMAQAFDVMGEFYKFAGPDNMAGMPVGRSGRLGTFVQCRNPGHDHRGLLASG